MVLLRARILVLGTWAHQNPGLYKALHESTLNQRADMPFKAELAEGATTAVQRCMDAGLAPADDDAATVALDLRAAVHGAVSMRVNQPDLPWPPLEGQVDRFLTKLVGVAQAPHVSPQPRCPAAAGGAPVPPGGTGAGPVSLRGRRTAPVPPGGGTGAVVWC